MLLSSIYSFLKSADVTAHMFRAVAKVMSCSAGAHAAPMKGCELLGSVCSAAASWGGLRATELCHPTGTQRAPCSSSAAPWAAFRAAAALHPQAGSGCPKSTQPMADARPTSSSCPFGGGLSHVPFESPQWHMGVMCSCRPVSHGSRAPEWRLMDRPSLWRMAPSCHHSRAGS